MNSFIFIILFVVSIIIFIVMREFWCWYWKINERIELLKDISEKLGQNIQKEKKSYSTNPLPYTVSNPFRNDRD